LQALFQSLNFMEGSTAEVFHLTRKRSMNERSRQ
jgi:hypothetical protein